MNALDNVLSQAQDAAANFTPAVIDNSAQLPAAAPQAGLPAQAPSVTNFVNNAGIVVDEYLYPDKAGFKISKDMKGYIDDFEAIIDMAEVAPILSFSAEINGASTFVKSYNGNTTPGGQNFALECQKLARQPGAKCRGPFETVEIPLVLAHEVKDPKSTLTFDEGTEIGLTPSPTGTKEFAKLLKSIAKIDPELVNSGRLRVKVVNKFRSNRNGNEWGVASFEYLGIAED